MLDVLTHPVKILYRSLLTMNSAMPCSLRWAFNFNDWRPTSAEWDLAARCVQKEEKERIHRFVFAEDSKASMVGQLLMRKATCACVGIPYNEITFSRSKEGKPYITNEADTVGKLNYHFNVSHQGDFCVLAAEKGFNVGIDIMKNEYRGSKPLPEYFNLMKRQFAHEEMQFISSAGSEIEKLRRFYRLWCLKESFVKANGTGISFNLSSVHFHCPTVALTRNVITTDTKLTFDGIARHQWKFEETLLDDDHCIAVAIENNVAVIDGEKIPTPFSILNYDELMKNCVPFENGDTNWECISTKKKKRLA